MKGVVNGVATVYVGDLYEEQKQEGVTIKKKYLLFNGRPVAVETKVDLPRVTFLGLGRGSMRTKGKARRDLRLGCGLFLLGLALWGGLLGGCGVLLWPRYREPELEVERLLERQAAVLPPGWGFPGLKGHSVRTTDDDTWAVWAVYASFQNDAVSLRAHNLDEISEEIHVFANPFEAWLISNPSPASIHAGKGTVPSEWRYRPPHAEGFAFGCVEGPEGQIGWCSAKLRYEEYMIVLFVPLSEAMTLGDFRRLLEVTDQEMTAFLERSTLRTGRRGVPEELRKWLWEGR